MNIYVGNLSYQITEDELKVAFEAFGNVDAARIITDRNTGRSKGFAFVEMPDRDQALAGIEGLNGTELSGRNITVNEARPRPERNDRRGGFGGGDGGGGRGRRGGFGGGGDRY